MKKLWIHLVDLKYEEMVRLPFHGMELQIAPEDIISAESDQHYVLVSTKKGPIRVRSSFEEVHTLMGARQFLLINRGKIVNMDHIRRLRTDTCELTDGRSLPIRAHDRAVILKKYQDYHRSAFFARQA